MIAVLMTIVGAVILVKERDNGFLFGIVCLICATIIGRYEIDVIHQIICNLL